MTFKTLLLILAPLATALVPPCLPDLGPQFCPGTPEAKLNLLNEQIHVQNHGLSPVVYPDTIEQEDLLRDKVFPLLNVSDLEEGLRLFTLPRWKPNRYCESKFGLMARDWVTQAAQLMVGEEINRPNGSSLRISFHLVGNPSPQRSIILRVMPPAAPYKPSNTIVIGAHMDSINIKTPSNQSVDRMVAPGADDNASGTIVLMTVLKALSGIFADKPVTNEVQFHWYGAEEIGLLGSKSVFANMRNQSFDVRAMLNLDMVGYAGGHEAGSPKIALQQGFSNKNLTDYVAKLIETYTDAKPDYTSCGYPCSDHASAHQNGYPAAMIGESSYLKGEGGAPNGNPHIHSEGDTIDTLDFSYMLEFAKVAAAFVTELAYTNFTELEMAAR